MTGEITERDITDRDITYLEAITEGIAQEMERDPDVLVLGEDVGGGFGGAFKVTKGLSTKYGAHRVRATPIAETEKLVEAFVAAQPKPAVNDKLTAVMGRTLDIINRDRASIIAVPGWGSRMFQIIWMVLMSGSRSTHHARAGPATNSDE